jgi:hypothetical protein
MVLDRYYLAIILNSSPLHQMGHIKQRNPTFAKLHTSLHQANHLEIEIVITKIFFRILALKLISQTIYGNLDIDVTITVEVC